MERLSTTTRPPLFGSRKPKHSRLPVGVRNRAAPEVAHLRSTAALLVVSPPGATAQPTSDASVRADMASQAKQKADDPKSVWFGGSVTRVVTAGRNVKTQKAITIKAETPHAASKRAELENMKEQPKRAPQPHSHTLGVSIGGNATQAIVVGEDLEATEGITIE